MSGGGGGAGVFLPFPLGGLGPWAWGRGWGGPCTGGGDSPPLRGRGPKARSGSEHPGSCTCGRPGGVWGQGSCRSSGSQQSSKSVQWPSAAHGGRAAGV